ncbi:hypothetical protein FisN_8Hh406 [Fistulifera solaris]|jgi:hypothetical protein|uniref:HSF-type DNA-binding domain-containing protein n=1 Tax=Fistulifera solaris TaxID=1519565 RepID=A0A1Z5JMR1_FISSO|nr:hypothetical protein FisN_8Hh406 [Fistulifera solaris]|eukprot:GAX15297.1 hypothetical protein FisN_8Hh406 [Fistulifera solaris]
MTHAIFRFLLVRQLNIYGFSRIPRGKSKAHAIHSITDILCIVSLTSDDPYSGPDKGGYFHENFLRGKPELAQRIPRQKFKGTGARKASSDDTFPDFYSMEPLPPVVDVAESRSEATASPHPIEPVENRDPAPWSTPPTQPRSCYELPPPHRLPQTVYAPTAMARRAIPMPGMIVVSDGANHYELLPRNSRAWTNQSPSSPTAGYFGYYNIHQRAGLQPSLCPPSSLEK